MTPEQMQQMMALMQAQGMMPAQAPQGFAAPAAPQAADPLMTVDANENFDYFEASEIGNVVVDIKGVTRFQGRNGRGQFKDFYSCAVEVIEAESPNLMPGITRHCHFNFMHPQVGDKNKGDAAAFMDVVAGHRGGHRSDPAWFNAHIADPSADVGCRLHLRVYPKTTQNGKTIALFEAVRVLPPGTTLGLTKKDAPAPPVAPAPAAAAAPPTVSPEDFAKFMAQMQGGAPAPAPAPAPAQPDMTALFAQMQAQQQPAAAPAPAQVPGGPPPGWPASLPWPPKVG